VIARSRLRVMLGVAALASAASGACSRMVIGRIPSSDGSPEGPGDGAIDRANDGGPDADSRQPPSFDGAVDASSDPPRDAIIVMAVDAAAETLADAPTDAAADPGDGSPATDAARVDTASTGDAPPTSDARASDATVDGRGDGVAPPDSGSSLPIGIIAGRISMSDNTGVRGAGVAGVRVSLTGAAARAAISDANGGYAFPNLVPGTYALALAKDGATFTPSGASVVVVGAGSAGDAGAATGVVASFTCGAPCGTGPTIDPARELFIQDPSVLTDARASNTSGGPWSFRFLMEQAATTSPNQFAEIWIANLAASGRSMTGLRAQWPTIAENTITLPDLSRAPFQLLAIVNGVDAHEAGQGEARLVYGVHTVTGAPELNGQAQNFTVMFRYALPATAEIPTRQAWAIRFHALGATPFGADYNTRLQALTDLFTRVAARPSSAENPRGSALIAVSINESFLGNNPQQLHESRLLPDPVRGTLDLMVTTLEQTPDVTLNAHDGALPDFLNANAALVQVGRATLPAALLATQSSAFSSPVPWSFPSVSNELLRHAFAGQTCAGCHSSEAPTSGFTVFHVIPSSDSSAASRSGYVSAVEIPRRVAFLQNQLTCTGASCALGAEPMMGPVR
jgi:hypothetical protein